MSILYDEGHQLIAAQARRVLDARVDRHRLLALLEQTGACDASFQATAVEQGWTALAISPEHGGLGLGLLEMGLVAQEAGRETAGAPILTTTYGAVQALLGGGDPAARARWLPLLASGEVSAAIAFGEGASPLPAHPSTRFDAGVLSGHKPGVVGGLFADFAIVWARRGDEPVLVLAEMAAEMTSAGRHAIHGFDNSRGHADLHFDATPATLLARGEAARELALATLARMAVVAAHEQVGGAEALLFTARDYALTRKAFGQPIGAFQSVKHRLAELYALVEIARANCIHAAAREGQGDFLKAAAAARLSASEAYDTAARDCVQIHGGIGVTWEAGLHLHMRRARSLAIELGNALFWEDLLAGELTGVAA